MQIEIYSNIKQASRALAKFDEIIQNAAAETLKAVGAQTAREAARMVVSSGYASKKLTPNQILGGKAKAMESISNFDPKPVGGVRTMIWYNAKNARQAVPISEQGVTVMLSMRSIPLFYFSPENKEYPTRLGPRWGVVVTVDGKQIDTGGFHMKRGKQGSPKGKGRFERSSQVIKRTPEGGYRPFSFKSVGLVLADKIEDLQNYGYNYFEKHIERNFKRHARQIEMPAPEFKKH